MKTTAIKKYRNFIDQAIDLVEDVIKSNEGDITFYTGEDWELCSEDRFNKHYNDFIAELNENSMIYDSSIIKTYIESEFSFMEDPFECYTKGGDGILDYVFFDNKKIIKKGIYVKNLLNVKKNATNHLNKVATLLREDTTRLSDEWKIYTSNVENEVKEKFNFEDHLKESMAIPNIQDRLIYFIEKKASFDQFKIKHEDYFFHIDSDYDQVCDVEIGKIKQIIKLTEDSQSSIPAHAISHNHKITNGKKTDFIKIISAMYDLRMFEKVDGRIADSKEALFKDLGILFNEDFNSYSVYLSKAKASSGNFLDIFDKLKNKAAEYCEK